MKLEFYHLQELEVLIRLDLFYSQKANKLINAKRAKINIF